LRFNAKEPQILIFTQPAPGGGTTGAYWLAFPTGIEAYGASFSTYVGESTLAGEVSVRRNMPLVSQTLFSLPGANGGGYGGAVYASLRAPGNPQPGGDISSTLSYAVGDTLQAQMSSVSTLSPNAVWDSADLSAEVALNDRLAVTSGVAQLAAGRNPFAVAMRAVLEPQFYEVLPALDLSTPIGLGYDLAGRSSVDSSMNYGAGDAEFGVTATWRKVWQGSITLTHFFGPQNRQPFADRDFVSISIQRTF
jgi:hypothetical protein